MSELNQTTPTTSETPPVQTGGVTAPADDAESSVWAGLLDDGDTGDYEWEEPAPAKAEGEGTPEPVVEEKVETSTEQKAEEPPPPQPQPQAPQAPQAPPQAPSPIDVERMRQQWLAGLAQRYQLTEEQAERLSENPREVLPQMAAQIHAQAMQEAMAAQARIMPGMVRQQLEADRVYAKATNDFFTKWPSLRGNEGAVQQIAVAYRAMKRGASYEQAIDEIGRLAHTYLNIPMTPQAAPPPPPPPVIPPRPGAVSGRATTPQPTQPTNPFAALAESFLREDAETFEE